jgi:hypothetical protein
VGAQEASASAPANAPAQITNTDETPFIDACPRPCPARFIRGFINTPSTLTKGATEAVGRQATAGQWAEFKTPRLVANTLVLLH